VGTTSVDVVVCTAADEVDGEASVVRECVALPGKVATRATASAAKVTPTVTSMRRGRLSQGGLCTAGPA
jgi:hypothetical protein